MRKDAMKIKKWKPEVGYPVEVFADPLTEHVHEGVAKIVTIHGKKSGILDCDVRFNGENQVVRRKIKYQA
jgi:hypothetical protein